MILEYEFRHPREQFRKGRERLISMRLFCKVGSIYFIRSWISAVKQRNEAGGATDVGDAKPVAEVPKILNNILLILSFLQSA